MTSTRPLPRGISSLIPNAQLLHLRSATVPVPVLAAAAELIAAQLEDPDPATREAAGAVHAPLLAAVEDAAPGVL
ncbi:hypothetical protein [Kitasatospora sp. NPDC101183]|uniref:hypothetical protein n=1 Tax=Kitasatospora sp. NPDC101183 TaxID=3364100 RepID=UPI00381F2439